MLPETKGKTYDELYKHFKVYDVESNGQTKAKPLPKVCDLDISYEISLNIIYLKKGLFTLQS